MSPVQFHRRRPMADLIYFALGLGSFALLGVYVRLLRKV